jgi:hypothetical protein
MVWFKHLTPSCLASATQLNLLCSLPKVDTPAQANCFRIGVDVYFASWATAMYGRGGQDIRGNLVCSRRFLIASVM